MRQDRRIRGTQMRDEMLERGPRSETLEMEPGAWTRSARAPRALRPGEGLQARLRMALACGQFDLCYQPIVDAHTLRPQSFEALLRWQDPQLGMLSPAVFIPVAERSRLILQIDRYVLGRVLAQLGQWRAAGLPLLPVSVNLSARELKSEDFVLRLCALLECGDLDPRLLQLEITEHALIDDFSRAARHLREATALGVSFALDDFGTGHSSFSHLRQLPIQRLKIDREFISGIDDDPRDRKIVRAITAMAHALELQVVAEGVETVAELATLQRVRCDQIQGFLTGRPMGAAAAGSLLAAQAQVQVAMAKA